MKLHKELARDVRNRRVEETESGILFPRSKIELSGVLDIAVNGGAREFYSNRIVTQGLETVLDVMFGATAKIAAFYLAPFAGNVTPAAGWTAANFTANSTEFTNYTEATRQEWDSTRDGLSISNVGARAVFTVGDGGQTTIWGAGMLSNSGKSSTSGVLVAAARLGTSRSGLQENDEVSMGYTLNIADAT